MNQTIRKIPTVSRWTTIHRVFKFVDNPIPILNEYQAEHGDNFFMYLGGMIRGLVTSDPIVIQQVLQKQHRSFEKSEFQVQKLGQYTGRGLLTNVGSDWLRQRRLIQPGFHRRHLGSLTQIMFDTIKRSADRMASDHTNGYFDITPETMRLAFDLVANSLFDADLDEDEREMLRSSITEIQEFIVRQLRQPFFEPWFQLSGQVRKYKQLAGKMRLLIKKQFDLRKKAGVGERDLIDMLLKARYEDTGEGMDDVRLVDEALILFAAGHETTANALAWMVYLLAKHPEVKQKVQEEGKWLAQQEEVDLDTVKHLPYTKQVVQEAMRIYPPAWVTDRVALEDVVVEGIPIKKGTILIINLHGVHHQEAYWPDSQVFDPDRWSPERKDQLSKNAYFPFGAGPRLCIGNHFAMMEMQLAIAYLFHRFDFELDPNHEVSLKPLITLKARDGIKVKLIKRAV